MPKTVIFHVGLPKTGTTSIQNYLRSQDDKLRSLGFVYPGSVEHPAMASFKHLMILAAMLGKPPPRSEGLDARGGRQAVERVFSDFRASDHGNLVWSHEGISARAFDLDADYVRALLKDLDVRIVLFARYLDSWVESLFMERIRAQGGPGRGGAKRPKPRLAGGRIEGGPRRRSMLEEASVIPGSLGALRELLPSAEIVVQSYDAHREAGKVVSGALAAMGVPAAAFPDADDAAEVRNPTKSNLYSMLIHHLLLGDADIDVLRAVTKATIVRDRKALEFEPLSGRRFRFLSEENIVEARGVYEELRRDYPDLPAQPPYAPSPAERSLPRDDGLALLEWLRPDISDATFAKARAAYTVM